MQKLLIRGGRVLSRHGWRESTDVRIEAGLIDRVDRDLAAPGGAIIDAQGLLVVPGFVDLHIHGAFGQFCESGKPEALHELSTRLPEFGVTGFLATVATLPRRALQTAVEAIAFAAGGEVGARILGIHLEGPYLNRHCAGAQNRRWMRTPDLNELDDLQGRSSGLIKMITVAPELPGAIPLIAAAAERSVIVALGHSEASEELALVAMDAGAKHVTHLYNAMGPFHHREPGLIGVALSEPGLTVDLIADGHHVRPRAIEIAWRARSGRGMVLVSDAIAAGLPDGEYEFLGTKCSVQDGSVRLAGRATLAGSCLSLDRAVRNVCEWLPSIPPASVIEAASTTPCRVLGLDNEYGYIEPGYHADLVLLDHDYRVRYTIVGGRVVYRCADA
ncbi:MAG: N-acetylglucosamine-6-phosphate deacetylase [Candidatus Binatia bacterium]|nr:MAG: N-acetylglucosamine-6-phosphate deacetylase [Candidatus Binatia bacterium]